MKSLEGVVWIDRDPTHQTVHLEGNHTGFPGLEVCQVLLSLDDVLQLASDEHTAEEPVQWADHATAGAPDQHTWPTQLIKRLDTERGRDGGSPESLWKNPGGRLAHRWVGRGPRVSG